MRTISISLVFLASTVAFGQGAPRPSPPSTSPANEERNLGAPPAAGPGLGTIDSTDRQFVEKAAAGGMAEVKLGMLAVEHASMPVVKDFGRRMIDDHTKANDELKRLAERKGITLPTEMSADDQRLYDRLSQMAKSHNPDFDRAYMDAMTRDHQEDVAEFHHEVQNGKDADLRAWAQKVLPTLEMHADMARQAEKKMKMKPETKPE